VKPVYCVNKPVGATPLSQVILLKKKYPELKTIRIGYAGRLDPMAEGLLLLLTGDENKKKLSYEKLSKTYTIEVLFGFSTDTQDILGIVTDHSRVSNSIHIPPITGTYEQTYPDYSSKRVNGKPLYYWARHGKPEGMVIPTKIVTVSSYELKSLRTISRHEILQSIQSRISLVSGDFRQKEILNKWNSVDMYASYPVAQFVVSCTSGTYMRSLAQRVGEMLHIPALAWTIRRDRIGEYTL
jgi:tRNA pseudouridine55 synthase